MSESIVLAGDLGGTHTRLRLARVGGDRQEVLFEHHYRTADFDQLLPMLQIFLAASDAPRPECACLAIAGPVRSTTNGEQGRVTRLQWDIDGPALQQSLGLARLRLINDFEAIGHAIAVIPDAELYTLQAGAPQARGARALIGAGTGLGQALLIHTGNDYRVQPTEGGHADFAPQDETQIALLRYLQQSFAHVSYDRVVSGPGLVLGYRFLCQQAGQVGSVDPDLPDAAERISQQAATDPLASQALELFMRLYGAQAGNLALTGMALGGLYIAGGIAPRILDRIRQGSFMQAFHHKGRMTELMHRFPVHVVLTEQPGLLGAVRVAGQR